MLIGSTADVNDFLKTTPWGLEQTVTFYEYRLDGESGWSVFLMADPTAGDDVEGVVYAYGPGKARAALVGIATKHRVDGLNALLREDAAVRDLRDLARLLERFPDDTID